jgi:hypothetical protein
LLEIRFAAQSVLTHPKDREFMEELLQVDRQFAR